MIAADHERYVGPRPVRACLPSALSEKKVRQTGGYSIDWSVRLLALALWLLPLVMVLLVGFMLLWVAGTFSHEK